MRAIRLSTALAALLALLLAPAPVLADHHEAGESAEGENTVTPWDPAVMTDLTSQLADKMSALRQAFRKEPVFSSPENANRRAAHQMEQTLRNLQISTRQLRNRVRDGANMQDTRMIAKRIGMLLNDADMQGRRLMTTAWMADQARPAMVLINEIAPYYGRDPLYDPETVQRLDRAPNPDRPPPPEE
ncbi:MAG: hypothetical protein JRH19_10980 [Deltaproteobacteria bacterium]|nr:hypothetical protein [Deltaproteobacteria bacterium]